MNCKTFIFLSIIPILIHSAQPSLEFTQEECEKFALFSTTSADIKDNYKSKLDSRLSAISDGSQKTFSAAVLRAAARSHNETALNKLFGRVKQGIVRAVGRKVKPMSPILETHGYLVKFSAAELFLLGITSYERYCNYLISLPNSADNPLAHQLLVFKEWYSGSQTLPKLLKSEQGFYENRAVEIQKLEKQNISLETKKNDPFPKRPEAIASLKHQIKANAALIKKLSQEDAMFTLVQRLTILSDYLSNRSQQLESAQECIKSLLDVEPVFFDAQEEPNALEEPAHLSYLDDSTENVGQPISPTGTSSFFPRAIKDLYKTLTTKVSQPPASNKMLLDAPQQEKLTSQDSSWNRWKVAGGLSAAAVTGYILYRNRDGLSCLIQPATQATTSSFNIIGRSLKRMWQHVHFSWK